MCEIYGFSGCRKRELNTDLQAFYSNSAEHPNGWGLALLDPNDLRIYRETVRADQRATALLQYQQDKLKTPCARYAERVIKAFSDKYDDVIK